MAEANEMGSVEGQLVGLPLAGPETFSVQQLAYLKQALGLDETTLFTKDPSSSVEGSFTVALSEAPTNFEYIEIMFESKGQFVEGGLQGNLGVGSAKLLTSVMGSTTLLSMVMLGGRNTTTFTQYTISCEISNLNTSSWSCVSALNGSTHNNAWFAITRVVGIHRIAGGN